MNVDMLEVQVENYYQQVLYNDYHNIHYVIDRLYNKNFYHNMKHLLKYKDFDYSVFFSIKIEIFTLILISGLFTLFSW